LKKELKKEEEHPEVKQKEFKGLAYKFMWRERERH